MKNNKTLLKYILTGILLLSTVVSCKKDFLDINQNPNDPEEATINNLLPSSEAAIAMVIGNNLQIFGGLWGQYWTQSPSSSQYKTIEQYSPAANDFDRPWKILYADALQDLKTIIEKATVENKLNYVACAKILQAYSFQLLTDNWGDVPFKESLLASQELFSPHYDRQDTVYNGIIKLLEEGDALIDLDENAVVPGIDDLLFGGDMEKWRKFGNTLKLRVYLRLAYVDPSKAQAGIVALDSAQAEFLGAGEEARINYSTAGGNTNPLYSSYIQLSKIQNLVASETAVDYLINNDDPRVDAFYTPAANGNQIGLPQGAYTLTPGTPSSIPGPLTGGDGKNISSASAPVRLMTGYESLFLQSEAVQRGYLTGDAKVLYEEAIAENFTSFGVVDTFTGGFASTANIAFPVSGTFDEKIEAIITQKWIAFCGNSGPEAWIEWRRTGYPSFFSESINSIIGTGKMPYRCFYPTAEVSRNANFPGQKLIFDKVWWDVN